MRASGLDAWPSKGPSDVDNMPKHRREQMNDLTELANYLY
jgi:hypothetical protein